MKKCGLTVLWTVILTFLSLTLTLVACTEGPAPAETDPAADIETEHESEQEEFTTMKTEMTDPAMNPPTEAATEAVTEVSTEATTEAATETPWAGENSGLTREDGVPKKYITLSFDDGITQDLKMIEILKKYNCPCTFNINTGLYGANWTWVADALNSPGLSHLRWTKEQLESGIYDGFDVEVHTLNHGSLKNMTDKQVIREVGKDAQNIAGLFGAKPVGMAYPGGDTEYNDHTIDVIVANTDIRFGRGITSTYGFALPQYFMTWQPTCSFSDGRLMSLTKQFIEAECTEDMLLYVWGHAYELDAFNTWERFDEFIRTITEAAAEDDTIVLVTNAEFYQLFKDQIPAWKSAD